MRPKQHCGICVYEASAWRIRRISRSPGQREFVQPHAEDLMPSGVIPRSFGGSVRVHDFLQLQTPARVFLSRCTCCAPRRMHMDLYSIGEMVIDFTPGSEPFSYVRNAGGAPANVAIEAARNGLEAAMLCSLGDDQFGRFLKKTLEENGVRAVRETLYPDAMTTMAFVTLDEDGDRTFTFARKPGADMFIEESDVREEDIKDSVIVHAGSCSLSAEPSGAATRRALRLSHELGRLTSFDVNYRDLLWNKDEQACMHAVRDVLPYVDLLKISEEEANALGGEYAIPSLMEENGITAVVETLGSRGVRCFFEDKVIDMPAMNVNCVDATAAGDAFWGGFLSALRHEGVAKASEITEDVLKKALQYGNTAGGICVQNYGAINTLPSREDIETLLEVMDT